MEIEFEIWNKMISAKTDKDIIVYFANLTDKQFWWDINPYYAAFNINEEHFTFIKRNLNKRKQLIFDEKTETYSVPINIIETEYINYGCENTDFI